MRREDKEIAHLLGEIMRLVEEANELERDGESRQAAAVRRDLEALRWRLAGVVSHDATYRSAA